MLPRVFKIDVPSAVVNYSGFVGAAEKRVIAPAGINEGDTRPLCIRLDAPSVLGKRLRAEFVVKPVTGALADTLDATLLYPSKRSMREHVRWTIVWEQHRPEKDAMFAETNLALACLSCSHTSSAVMNGEDAGDMVEEYQQAYMTKEKGGLKHAPTVMYTALTDIQKFPSVAEDGGTSLRNAKHLATRTVNAFTGGNEWSHSLMAHGAGTDRFSLAIHSDAVSSDAKLGGASSETELCGVANGGVKGDVNLETARDDHPKPEQLASLALWRARTMAGVIVDILPRGGCDGDAVYRGRPRRQEFDLGEGHPLCSEYQGFLRAKFRAPVLGGAPPPPMQKNGEASPALSRHLIALLTPWRPDEPEYELPPSGLSRVCKNWNSAGASFISRQRYRYLDSVLKKQWRSAQNEKVCSEWRRFSPSDSSEKPEDLTPDQFGLEEITQLASAAAAKDLSVAGARSCVDGDGDPSGIAFGTAANAARAAEDESDRSSCSPDQLILFDRIIQIDDGNGGLHQTLSLLHGGGGT
ncbi:hypothetical protein GN958_ATG06846, partial [Phytophthora infestans]